MTTRRFQLHLVSVIVLTASAGAVLGLNLRVARYVTMPSHVETEVLDYCQRGWPLAFSGFLEKRTLAKDRIESLAHVGEVLDLMHADEQLRNFRASRIAADIACGLLIVLAATAITEWLARRRDDKREAARR